MRFIIIFTSILRLAAGCVGYRIKYIYICDDRYDVRRRSVVKAVMLLPGLEAPEGGNMRGIYGLLAGLRCWHCYCCCLGGFRLDCPFWDLLLFVLLWPVVIPVFLMGFIGVCCVRKWSWQFLVRSVSSFQCSLGDFYRCVLRP